ncbi:MAG: type II toxin-antitoxin system RelE/ParE family toxin [Thermotogota bacterium]|nr:type II toxin-antitoxin system RelE/ParE family toxin [Thermotogota bacterium]
MVKIKWHKEAVKEIQRLPTDKAKMILDKISELSLNPNLGAKLKGYKLSFRRLRIGDVRVIYFYDIEKEELKIYRIGFRGDVYKNL